MVNRTILAVDDEPLITRLIQINLRPLGYTVNTAQNGVEALALLQSGEALPALILLDVNMPYMDGYALLKEMQQDETLRNIPVVMLTAHFRDEDIRQAHTLGASIYLNKPVQPQELVRIVKGILEGEDNP